MEDTRMMYLGTNEFGHDSNDLGFPEIHSCHAITYQTKTILYGWHDSSGSVDLVKLKAANFKNYIQSLDETHSDKAERIVGVINANHRFSKQSQGTWKEELLAVAEALGFQGPVLGYRCTSHIGSAKVSGQGGGDKIYVQFDRNGQDWHVYYKTWYKLQYGGKVDESEGNRRQFRGLLGAVYDPTYEHLKVINKDTSSGKLHEISHSSFTQFQ
jgi:hypothetical protein